jgi:hypothetical protein
MVTIAHNSGGPKTDIVRHGSIGTPHPPPPHMEALLSRGWVDPRVGFLAATEEEYAECMETALVAKNEEPDAHTAMQREARLSSQRFSDEAFGDQFAACLTPLAVAALS